MATIIDTAVNQPPILTWNHLDINRSRLEARLEKEAGFSLTMPDDELDFQRLLPETAEKAARIESGLGASFDAQFDAVTKDAGIMVGKFIVPAGFSAKPVRLSYNLADGSFSAADTVIYAEEGSSSIFILDFASLRDAGGSFGSRITVHTGKDAVVHLVTVNLLGNGFSCFNSVGAKVEDGAYIACTQLELGGAQVHAGTYAALTGNAARFNGRLGYMVRAEHSLDVNYVSRQEGRGSASTMSVDGVLADKAKKTWRGTIDFRKGCAESTGDEQENVLLLSPDVVNKSLPVILCDEEAVDGRHGASIGRLGKELLFYMQSRGLDAATAQKLVVKAKMESVCRHIPDAQLVEAIQNYIEGALAT